MPTQVVDLKVHANLIGSTPPEVADSWAANMKTAKTKIRDGWVAKVASPMDWAGRVVAASSANFITYNGTGATPVTRRRRSKDQVNTIQASKLAGALAAANDASAEMFTTNGGARFDAVIDLKKPNFEQGMAQVISATGQHSDRVGPAGRFAYALGADDTARFGNNTDGGDVFSKTPGYNPQFMRSTLVRYAVSSYNAIANKAVVQAIQGVDLTNVQAELTAALAAFINDPTYTVAAGSVATVAIVSGQVELAAELWIP